MPTATALFTAQTTNGQSSTVTATGGPIALFVWGTFDTALVKVQYAFESGGEWFDDNVTFSKKGHETYTPPHNVLMRVDLSGAMDGTSISVTAY